MNSESVDIHKSIQPLGVPKEFVKGSVPASGLLQPVVLLANVLVHADLGAPLFFLRQKQLELEALKDVVLGLLEFGNLVVDEVVHLVELATVLVHPVSQHPVCKQEGRLVLGMHLVSLLIAVLLQKRSTVKRLTR